jgi:anti-sigma factor RsiW
MHRQGYIRRLKRDLHRWDGQIAAWEETLFEVRGDARKRLAGRVASWRGQRNAVASRLRELQSESAPRGARSCASSTPPGSTSG